MTTLVAEVAAGRSLWIELSPSEPLIDLNPRVNLTFDEAPHCTLVFLGKGLQPTHVEAVQDMVERMRHPPIKATIGGVARFAGNDREGDPIVALLQEPRIRETRLWCLAYLEQRGVPLGRAADYDYTPHMTLRRQPQMLPVNLSTVKRAVVTLDVVAACAGDARFQRPLGVVG